MKLSTIVLSFGTLVGVTLSGAIGYHIYDQTQWDQCKGTGEKIQACAKVGLYQDQVRFFEYATLKTNNVKIRCTDSQWSWDRTGTRPEDRIHTNPQLNEIANSYCDNRYYTHQ